MAGDLERAACTQLLLLLLPLDRGGPADSKREKGATCRRWAVGGGRWLLATGCWLLAITGYYWLLLATGGVSEPPPHEPPANTEAPAGTQQRPAPSTHPQAV
ncbi:hypothetical protein B0J11DRAFT_502771 [Dendryphion nanum]|uniref:Uncharacterized protein n=1 Tax=Dendryphion nanum TaxID=256645 RepID=A0A9P9EF48_9PLEO|nr:hypothetical protein B0J11DRAFT_502771 [Dendryphion nanum]